MLSSGPWARSRGWASPITAEVSTTPWSSRWLRAGIDPPLRTNTAGVPVTDLMLGRRPFDNRMLTLDLPRAGRRQQSGPGPEVAAQPGVAGHVAGHRPEDAGRVLVRDQTEVHLSGHGCRQHVAHPDPAPRCARSARRASARCAGHQLSDHHRRPGGHSLGGGEPVFAPSGPHPGGGQHPPGVGEGARQIDHLVVEPRQPDPPVPILQGGDDLGQGLRRLPTAPPNRPACRSRAGPATAISTVTPPRHDTVMLTRSWTAPSVSNTMAASAASAGP